MRLYLVQHGDSLPKETDPDRPLSAKGLSDIQRLAAFLGGRMQVSRIWHSGKTRARQTAELLAAALVPGRPVAARAGIDPLDPVDAFASQVRMWDEDALVAGHQPFLGRLVARLLRGVDEPELVLFEPGTAVCLERSADGRWIMCWLLYPGFFA